MNTLQGVIGHPGYWVDVWGGVWTNWIGIRRKDTGGTRRQVQELRKLVPWISNGYACVSIDGKFYRVHQLMLLVFVGPCPEEHECRHLDGDKLNNYIGNLIWGTHSENANDRGRLGEGGFGTHLPGEANGRAVMTNERVKELRDLATMPGITQAYLARKYGLSKSQVRNILRRKCWKHI